MLTDEGTPDIEKIRPIVFSPEVRKYHTIGKFIGKAFEVGMILFAPQAILGFMTRLAKLQELGLTPSNSLQFLTPDSS